MFFSLPPIWLVLGNTVLGLAAGAPDKNVVLFMPDDMHFLTGWPEAPPVAGRSTGNIPPASLAPNMNRIRDEGAVFTSAYVAGPKCAPSRFNLLTGRYCSRSSFAIGRAATTGTIDEAGRTVVGVSVQDCKLAGDDLEFTLANQLRAEGGYRTIVAGKVPPPPSWSHGSRCAVCPFSRSIALSVCSWHPRPLSYPIITVARRERSRELG